MLQKIKAGISTWVGIAVGIALLLPPAANQIISYIENNATRFSGPEKLMAIIGMVPVLGVIVGRMAQAVAAIIKKPPVVGLSTVPPVVTQPMPLDQVREALNENPDLIQQLKNEGTIT